MNSRRDRQWEWLLASTLVVAGGCGLSNGDANIDAGSTQSTQTSHVEESPHLGPGSIRCSRCHSNEDRQAPRWKEIAKKVGHDVDAMLSTRTTCTCCHVGE